MTPEHIIEIINSELKTEPNINFESSYDLNKCLIIPPIKQSYKGSNESIIVFERWTVFEERKDGNGYKIYFNEGTGKFGLAVKSTDLN